MLAVGPGQYIVRIGSYIQQLEHYYNQNDFQIHLRVYQWVVDYSPMRYSPSTRLCLTPEEYQQCREFFLHTATPQQLRTAPFDGWHQFGRIHS